MRVERVRYRNNPTLTCALMADGPSNECGLFWAALRSAGIWADLQKLGIPGIQGVWSIPEAAGWGMTVVSIKQMYAGTRGAGDGACRAMHRRRLFRQIRHRRRRRHRPEQCRSGAVGDGDALAAGAVDRHPARDLEHVPRPEPQPAGNPAVGLEGADQRLHGLTSISSRSRRAPSSTRRPTSRWCRAGTSLGFSGAAPQISIFEDKTSAKDVT